MVVKSVRKALDILQFLSNNPGKPVMLTEISRQVGINISTCSHILETLSSSLMVERVSRKEGYRLGPGAYMLTRFDRYREELIKIAAPVLEWLSKNVEGAVFLATVCDGVKYVVYHIDKNGILENSDGRMIKGCMRDTATGMLLLAYMGKEELNRVAFRENDNIPSVFDVTRDMSAEFTAILEKKYYHIYHADETAHSYAFTVRCKSKEVASIGVLYLGEENDGEISENVIRKGMLAAKELSRRLAFD